MKVVGFSSGGVGRDSNVDRMVKAILDKSGHETEFVKLAELNYSACKGCVDLCAKPQACQLEDDLFPYYQKIKEADAVVLGSAIYFGTINASMMSFIERFFGYRHVDLVIQKKPFVLVVSGGGRSSDGAVEEFRNRLRPFGVRILDVVSYESGIPPCFRCGRHKECSIGGLYGAVGKAAHTMEIMPEFFHRWEEHPPVVEAVEGAAEKLRAL